MVSLSRYELGQAANWRSPFRGCNFLPTLHPTLYPSTCWMVQRLTSRSLASSRVTWRGWSLPTRGWLQGHRPVPTRRHCPLRDLPRPPLQPRSPRSDDPWVWQLVPDCLMRAPSVERGGGKNGWADGLTGRAVRAGPEPPGKNIRRAAPGAGLGRFHCPARGTEAGGH